MYSTLCVRNDVDYNSREEEDSDSIKAPKFLSLVTGEGGDPKKDGDDGSAEPVEALDLRMSKMDECVSMYDDVNLLSEPHGGLPSAAGAAETAADANSRRRREERAPYSVASRFPGVRTPETRDYFKPGPKDPQYLAKHLHTPDPKLPSLAPPSPNSLTEAAAAKSRSIFQPLHEHNNRQQQHHSHRNSQHHPHHHPNSAVAHPTSPPPLTHLPKSSPSHLPLAANPRHSLFRSSLQNGASKPRSYWRSHYAEQDDEGIGHEEIGNGDLKIKEEPPQSPLPQPPHRNPYFNNRHHVPQPYSNKGYNSQDEDEHLVLQYPPQSNFRQTNQHRPQPQAAQTYLQRRSCSPEEPRVHPPTTPTHHQLLQQHQAHQRQMLNHHHHQQQQQQQQHRRGENGYPPLGQVPPHFPSSKHNPFARGGGAVHPSMRVAMGGGEEGHLGGFLQQVLRRPPAAANPYLQRPFHHHQQLMQQQQRNTHRPLSSLDSHLWALEQSHAHWGLTSSISPPPSRLGSPPASPWRDDGRDSVNTVSSTGVGSGGSGGGAKGRRGRPRKHAVKIPLPPLYVFIRNLLHSRAYNPRVVSWVSDSQGIFKVTDTQEFARTWGLMKSNRSEEMNYEKMSRAMRYHYGSEKQGRKGHLGMVREKRLVYRFGELAVNWRRGEVRHVPCQLHQLCKGSLCLWTKE